MAVSLNLNDWANAMGGSMGTWTTGICSSDDCLDARGYQMMVQRERMGQLAQQQQMTPTLLVGTVTIDASPLFIDKLRQEIDNWHGNILEK